MSSQLPHPVLDPPSPASRLFGYARVSTDDQDLSLQIDALQQHGIPKTAIFMDKVSGAQTERPGLTKCLESLTSGDILVVWRLPHNTLRGGKYEKWDGHEKGVPRPKLFVRDCLDLTVRRLGCPGMVRGA